MAVQCLFPMRGCWGWSAEQNWRISWQRRGVMGRGGSTKMLVPSLGPPPSGCTLSWAEDLSTSSQPLSSVGTEALTQELGLPGCSPESSAVFPPPSLASACCAEGLTAEQLLPPALHGPWRHCGRESAHWAAPRGTPRGELLYSICCNGVSPELDCSWEPGHWPLLLGMEKEYGNGVPAAPCSAFFLCGL